MCQYAETFHEYSGCKVRETVKAAEDAPNGGPEPSNLARFLKLFGNLRPRNNQDREGEESADANEVEFDFHPIKETNVWQCEEASRDASLGVTPEKRKCTGDKLVYWQGEDRKGQIENVGFTRERGECPVCVAVEQVIKEKLNPTEIRPYTRAAQPEPAPEPRNPKKRRTGEGTQRNPIKHGSRPPPVVERRRIVTSRRKRPQSDCSMM